MSLIRVRRERREMSGTGARKGQTPARLVFLLVVVFALIWWMTRLGG